MPVRRSIDSPAVPMLWRAALSMSAVRSSLLLRRGREERKRATAAGSSLRSRGMRSGSTGPRGSVTLSCRRPSETVRTTDSCGMDMNR